MSLFQEGDEAQLLYGHHEEVEGATRTAKELALSRRQEARAEADLGRIARMERERVRMISCLGSFVLSGNHDNIGTELPFPNISRPLGKYSTTRRQ